MTTTRVLAGLVSNGNVLADGVITPAEIGVLSISSVTYPGDDQAANPAGGQTITVNGAGFASTPTVYVNGVIAPSVSFVSSTQITFTSPARSAGTYDIYVVNPSGSTAIRVYGISYSGTPTWTTAAGELGPVDANFTIQLAATGDAPLTYALTSGSTLPSGVTLSSGGLITGSALTVEQTFNFSVDAIDAQSQETPRSFSVSVSLADPYFRYVTMLLSGDTAVMPFDSDASTNNFDIAINGDVRSNDFNPYRGAGYYSNSFGASNYLYFANNAALSFGTGDFCVEAWVYRTAAANESIIDSRVSAGASPWAVYVDGSNFPYFYDGTSYVSTTAITLNAWNHVAVTRSSGVLKIFVNGVQGYSATVTSNLDRTGGNQVIGGNVSAGTNIWSGYISNLRIVKGTAVYTAAFTPPTAPLTAISGTSLLTCQSNRFIDNSTNAFALTVSGSPQVASAQPFTLPGGVATYGSGYFDGSGDYLTAPASTSWQFTGDYTVEAWIYVFSVADGTIYGTGGSGSADQFTYISTGALYFGGQGTGAGVITINNWIHVAAARSGTTQKIFVNGVVQSTATVTGTIGQNLTAYIGRRSDGINAVNGYISDLRVVKGTAVYTSAFTPPTAPLTAVTNTSLLSLQYNGGGNNSGFKDSSQNNWPVTRVGNASQGTFSPYGSNWSTNFGSANFFYSASNAAFAFGTGDFTVEAWVNPSSYGTLSYVLGVAVTNGLVFYVNSGNLVVRAYNTGDLLSSSTIPALNTWTHVAATRSGTTLRIFVNGVQTTTTTNSTNFAQGAIYAGNDSSNAAPWFGYISNLRVVKGTAVYTSNFTPSTTPLTAISGTSWLVSQSNRFIDNSSNAFTITTSGTPSVQRFSPFGPTSVYSASTIGGSVYFDGSGDYLTAPSTSGQLGSGDFTIECWSYLISRVSIYPCIWGNYTSFTTGSLALFAGHNSGGTTKYNVAINGIFPAIQSTDSIIYNQWTHLALVRSGSTITLYVNGVANGTYSTSATLNGTSGISYIGSAGDDIANGYINGYLSNMRVSRSAVYTSAFTPPTAPLTPTANTSLLLSNTNSGVVDSSMMNDLETIGNAQISTSVKKYGTGSMYFDGNGDYLSIPTSPNLNMGTGDWTIECWVYVVSRSLNYPTIFGNNNGSYSAGALSIQNSNNDASAYYDRFVLAAYDVATPALVASSTNSLNTWYHLAVVRNGTSLVMYRDGTSVASRTISSGVVFDWGKLGSRIGGGNWDGAQSYFNGYIDDLRITKGYARYTANFTPPTAAFKLK